MNSGNEYIWVKRQILAGGWFNVGYKRSVVYCKTVIHTLTADKVTSKMKSLVFISVVLAATWCVVFAQIPIIRKEQKVVGANKAKDYKFIIETANGIYQEEQGIVKNADDPGLETQLTQGQYQYVSPEGEVIQLTYTADENGFRPVGKHIPTPPPVPKEIQRLLDYLATKKPESTTESDYDDSSILDLPK